MLLYTKFSPLFFIAEILKKINDYVNKGDVIISGLIMKKDEIKDFVEAHGSVYGETWYNVKVILPRTYKTTQGLMSSGNACGRINLA